MDAETAKKFEMIKAEMILLRQRMEGLLARGGGYVDGHVRFAGDVDVDGEAAFSDVVGFTGAVTLDDAPTVSVAPAADMLRYSDPDDSAHFWKLRITAEHQLQFAEDFAGSTSWPVKFEGSGTTNTLYVDAAGRVGILDSTPANELDVAGDVRADSYIEYSAVFVGDALAALRAIEPDVQPGALQGDWQPVDHDTLPVRLRRVVRQRRWFNKRTDGQMPRNFSPEEGQEADYEIREFDLAGRDLGATVQMSLRALVQLLERVEALEAQARSIHGTMGPEV